MNEDSDFLDTWNLLKEAMRYFYIFAVLFCCILLYLYLHNGIKISPVVIINKIAECFCKFLEQNSNYIRILIPA